MHSFHSCTEASSKDDQLDHQHDQQTLDNYISAEVAAKANWRKATARCNETGWQKEEAASRRPRM